MAVNYVAQKCTSCAATKLEYIKELKAWQCLYCGALIERHEQADTMFTIKNVVRQALLDVAYTRMDSAKNNLVECEKIDSRYVGTLIAQIAYEMNMIIHGGIGPNEQRNMFALLKKNYGALTALGEEPTDEEAILYEFFESSEIVGLLILVYDSLNAVKRRDFLYPFFDAAEIYSLALNTDLINYSLKHQKFEVFDKIVHNTDNINTKAALGLILSKYPDGEQKRAHVQRLSALPGSLTEDDRRMAEEYLDGSSDCLETKTAVAVAFADTPARPSIECLMRSVTAKLTAEADIAALFDALMKKTLLDVEVYTILDFAVQACSDGVCEYILTRFYETKQFVELSYKHFQAILSRDSDAACKKRLIDIALQFNVTEKVKESFIASYLCDTADSAENRQVLIPYLLSLVEMLSTNSVERYLYQCRLDGERKVDVVKMLFGMKVNRSFFHNTLSNYVRSAADPFEVKKEIIYILAGAGLSITADAALDLLQQDSLRSDEKIALYRLVKNNSVNTDEIVNGYLTGVAPAAFDPAVFAELLAGTTVISEKSFIRYVLVLRDAEAAKISHVSRMSTMCYSGASDIRCSVNHDGRTVVCNLVQGYILAAPESEAAAVSVLSVLSRDCRDLNTEIDAGGSRIKFKKYIAIVKNGLDGKTKRLCKEARVL